MYPIIGIFPLQYDFIEKLSVPILIAFITSLSIVPLLILLVNKYQWHDMPDMRKTHTIPIPTFGGIAIYLGSMVALSIITPGWSSLQIILLLAITVVFIMGVYDDARNMRASHKLLVELMIGLLVAVCDIRIQTLHGMFGIHELPILLQYLVTIMAVAGITNALNLIDGIDGLASGLSCISLLAASIILWQMGDPFFAILSASFAGGVAAFLFFNRHPAKIFMGDTGSLTLGLVLSLITIRIMQNPGGHYFPLHIPITALSLVLIPVFDTIRVFSFRLLRGQSPFNPDKTHIHHLLTNAGFPHNIVTRVICMVHMLILAIVFTFTMLDAEILLATITGLVICVTLVFKTISDKRLAGNEDPLKEHVLNQ